MIVAENIMAGCLGFSSVFIDGYQKEREMKKKVIYAKQVGTEVRFVELANYEEAGIMLLKKLRFKRVDTLPAVSKTIQNVRELGMRDLINPMKERIIRLLEDPAWVVLLFDAVKKEEINPTLQKMYNR